MAEQTTTRLAGVAEEAGVAKPDPILVVDNITRRFGGMTAVDVAHLEVQRGAITALIGPNGAGKTTFFNLITGFDKPSSAKQLIGGPSADAAARWSFDGATLGNTAAFKVSRAGMVRTFQLTKALSNMTVLENMLIGAKGNPGENLLLGLIRPVWKGVEKANIAKAHELLTRFKLESKAEDKAGSLSGGQKKLLEMSRALMSDPKMIMLDEPMAGVNPALTQSLLEHIQGIADDGTTVLFVEHDMHVVQHISDWVVVMAQGQVVAEGNPRSVMKNPAVVDAYLGAHHDTDLGDDSLLSGGLAEEIEKEAEAEAVAENPATDGPASDSTHPSDTHSSDTEETR